MYTPEIISILDEYSAGLAYRPDTIEELIIMLIEKYKENIGELEEVLGNLGDQLESTVDYYADKARRNSNDYGTFWR